jgi:hypothetical protein
MLPFIPVFVALTLTVGYVAMMQASPSQPAVADALAVNMSLFHDAGVRAAVRQSAPAGPISAMPAAPFSDMGDWETEVFDDGNRVIVATWSGADRIASSSEKMFDEVHFRRAVSRLERDVRASGYPSRAGLLLVEGATETVGGIDVSGHELPILEDAPVLVTIIR